MSSAEPRRGMRRFPIGLTIATLISLVILGALGSWQLKRLAWKTDILTRIEALKTAPSRPLQTVLALAAKGENVDFTRVSVDCAPTHLPPSHVYLFGLNDGRPAWRNLAACDLGDQVIIVDRGFALVAEDTHPPAEAVPAPVAVTGILRNPPPLTGIQKATGESGNDKSGWQTRQAAMQAATPTGRKASPFILVAESETPAPFRLHPSPLPTDIPNRHLEYALTWFGLAGVLIAIYAAMLWRRFKA